MNEEISKAVLGETLTTAIGDTGSFAAAQTHNGVRMELIKADADLLSATLNSTLLAWLTEFHFSGANPPRLWRRVEVPKDEKAEADKDLVIFQMGFAPEEEYIQKKYGDGWHARSFAPGGELGMDGQPPAQAQPQGEGEVLDAEIVQDGEDGPAGGGAARPTPGAPLQNTALNGAQVKGLLEVLAMTSKGGLPKEAAVQVIKAAFPGVPDQVIAGMINPIEVKEPEPEPDPAPAPAEPKAEFAEPKRPWWWRWAWPPAKKRAEYAEPRRRAPRAQDDADILTDKAEAAAAQAMDALMEPVRSLVANAASFAEILDGLADLYPDMDGAGFAKVLETAVAAANLAGAATIPASKRRDA
jgi:hypothetical protein